jgi:TolA-binding protein
VIIADPNGIERYRFEGYLPVGEFLPQIRFGLAKGAFAAGNFARAESLFHKFVEERPDADIAPESLYWAGIAKYKKTGDAAALAETAAAFQSQYACTAWAKKASVWRG